MGRRPGKRKRGVGRLLERVALGAVMSVVAFIVERRLMKVLRRRGEAAAEPEARPDDVELSVSPEQVDQ